MEHNYEDIVRAWYNRLRPEFLRRLTARYSGLTLYEAENLYQDAFIAVQQNIVEGRVRENTSWSNYILTIGMNLASHKMRKISITSNIGQPNSEDDEEDEHSSYIARKAEDVTKVLPDDFSIDALAKDPEAVALLGDLISHTPEPCKTIIVLFYEKRFSYNVIAQVTGLKNAMTAKVKKYTCMKDFINRGRKIFRSAGYLD